MNAPPGGYSVPIYEIFRCFGRIGLVSFGGPAGQIALMHRVLVEEKAWLDDRRFLHALNFCMLLPGPEAMQLATYSGWLLRGVTGGLIAGLLFVLPGFLVLLALSAIYAQFGEVPAVSGLLFGLKAAVLAIVFQALAKVGSRALKGWPSIALAVAAFAALAVFRLPFPMVIAAAALFGAVRPDLFGQYADSHAVAEPRLKNAWAYVGRILLGAIVFWVAPVLILVALTNGGNVYAEEALFFSKTAMVTFGGAYAVLAYVGQQAVEFYQWMRPDEMLTGLGLAETTPGPLILVLVFVGFMGAFREASGLDPMTAGVVGAIITTWVTFVPCFIWIFLGAPFIEQLRGKVRLNASFAAITAAVVGVIANLSFWFALHVLFYEVGERRIAMLRFWWPDLGTINPWALGIALLAGLMLWRGSGLFTVLGAATLAGLLVKLSGFPT